MNTSELYQYVSVSALRVSAPPRETTPTYDADGNLTRDGRFAYAYDAENSIVSVCPTEPVNGAFAVENRYDHRHRRTRKTVKKYVAGVWEAFAAHIFVWDGDSIVLVRITFAGGTSRTCEYFWGNDVSGALQGAGGVGGLLYVKVNGTIYVPHADAYGNIMRYTDTAGNLVAEYVYDAFGRTIAQTGPLADLFRHRFSSKHFDVEAGLYYYGYRFYSPGLRRWLNRDPIGEMGGENLYGFCGNNAIAFHDKDGNAYFAVRGLGKVLPPVKWSSFFTCPFMKIAVDVAADWSNVELLHEQLFFEDGQGVSSVGWSSNGKLINEEMNRYVVRDGGYDDCIMRRAYQLVNPDHYQMTWVGNKTKCNCQDYADALRSKYSELANDKKVRCACERKGR